MTLDWQPFELRPDAPEAGWALPERVRAMKNSPNNPLKQRARELGIELAERDWIPSSRRAHECTELARQHGKLDAFHAAVLRMYWSEGRDIHDWDVLEAAAVEAGVDPAAMRAAVEAGTLEPVVDELVAAAHAIGVHAVPTFVIGDRFVIEGAQPLEVFERVIARLAIDG